MMFNLMRARNLLPPMYREIREEAQQAVSVTLSNEEQPPLWDQVSDWIDRNGPIANADLCQIASIDTLRASKQLKRWVDQGLLRPDASRGKRNMVYLKPNADGTSNDGLLSDLPDHDG